MKTLKKSDGALGKEDAEMENAGEARLGMELHNRRPIEAVGDVIDDRADAGRSTNPVASMQAALALELNAGTPFDFGDQSIVDSSIEALSRIAGPIAMLATIVAAAWAVGFI
ncbi:hypothetical protein PX699_08830 [Sphingobium sp. H39-3-25]|uniref:hypothetical protein n=1 Tax=Sphingobium arseniciresistens TaxID=3030834 RepID=UPI0023BA3C72|nr:hypothetical protein [Sphingobium arseniciresistens]